ncbi:MAG TPA: hypothetical protein VJ770_29595 [Stellaceae bacterium]|nr:hypothetical protein [Stellaceae bacterium]
MRCLAGQDRYRRLADHRGRAQRWRDAVAELEELQAGYQAWLDSLPPGLEERATAEALRTTCEIDLSELAVVVPPRGYGRD